MQLISIRSEDKRQTDRTPEPEINFPILPNAENQLKKK